VKGFWDTRDLTAAECVCTSCVLSVLAGATVPAMGRLAGERKDAQGSADLNPQRCPLSLRGGQRQDLSLNLPRETQTMQKVQDSGHRTSNATKAASLHPRSARARKVEERSGKRSDILSYHL